jgi:hypothetical protein
MCVAPSGAGTVASPSARSRLECEEVEEGRRPLSSPFGELPPGRTGPERVGRENDAEREEEVEEGLRAFVAVLAAKEGDGRLRVRGMRGRGRGTITCSC